MILARRSLVWLIPPSLWTQVVHGPHNGLAAWLDLDVLHGHRLFGTLAPVFLQGFYLAEEYLGQGRAPVDIGLHPWSYLVGMQGLAQTLHDAVVNAHHLDRQHGLQFIPGPKAMQDGTGVVKLYGRPVEARGRVDELSHKMGNQIHFRSPEGSDLVRA
jgi:hypothetical protein